MILHSCLELAFPNGFLSIMLILRAFSLVGRLQTDSYPRWSWFALIIMRWVHGPQCISADCHIKNTKLPYNERVVRKTCQIVFKASTYCRCRCRSIISAFKGVFAVSASTFWLSIKPARYYSRSPVYCPVLPVPPLCSMTSSHCTELSVTKLDLWHRQQVLYPWQ